jgi:hypothetical protein
MHWLGKRSLVDFSATVAAIATRVPGLVALDVGDDMGGSGGRWGVRGPGRGGRTFFFKLEYLLYASAAGAHSLQSGAGL